MEEFKVDGVSYTYIEYKQLPIDERAAMKNRAVDALIRLNSANGWNQTASTLRWPGEVVRVMADWESTVETPSERLGRLLATMDWFYSYSDDHRVWSKYNAQLEQIRALTVMVGTDVARPIWEQFAPGKLES